MNSDRGGVPASVDRNRASIARVYDTALGGKDNFEVDREVVEKLRQVAPEISQFTVDHRQFLIRVTRFLTGQAGISQFLDLGSGLPTAENTHQAAHQINPKANVVYVDNDPSVVAHGRALLEDNDRTWFSAVDLTDADAVLTDPVITEHIDFTQPIGLLQLGTLHHHVGEPTPVEIMQSYIDALPSGSYVALSHFYDPEDENSELARRMENVFVHSPLGSGVFRTKSEILAMMPGLELVEPGFSQLVDWWPSGPRLQPYLPSQRCLAGAVGRKP
ncbi:SAM-dependent methyltransferase [Actinomycetospora endophytica]|uniref:SAM-dependent methyltransferase n=1 Tax=Actinomycetospora endophytica TaxID=2291215 RepID=A0ABS8P460_9PSEU|nr:SAM-dependent methyltransferase [Actinomycetospora endophytica]MCD2191844.1 SAM-dependent methyltransferase [Actinomycetospora endophytica]